MTTDAKDRITYTFSEDQLKKARIIVGYMLDMSHTTEVSAAEHNALDKVYSILSEAIEYKN